MVCRILYFTVGRSRKRCSRSGADCQTRHYAIISASSQTTEDPVLPVLDEPVSCNCFRKRQSLYANLADGNNNTCTNIDDASNLSDHVSELDISDYEADAEESQEDTSHSITM